MTGVMEGVFSLPGLLAMSGFDGEMAREWTLGWGEMLVRLLLVLVFVLLNGFFVAAEFSMVKVRATQLDALIDEGKGGAKLARRMAGPDLDASLSACQLGITLASLALGWIGEPFVGKLVQPLLFKFGLGDVWVLWLSIFLAFSSLPSCTLWWVS